MFLHHQTVCLNEDLSRNNLAENGVDPVTNEILSEEQLIDIKGRQTFIVTFSRLVGICTNFAMATFCLFSAWKTLYKIRSYSIDGFSYFIVD